MLVLKKIIKIIFSLLFISMYAVFVYLVNDLGLLSNNYSYVFVFLFFIIIAIIILLLYIIKNKIIKTILYFISAIILLLITICVVYLSITLNFVNSFSKAKDGYDYYYVIALKSSKYNNLSDLKNKTIGQLNNLNIDLDDKIKIKYKLKTYDNAEILYENLLDKNVDSIILNDLSEYILEENTKYDFIKKIKVIYKIKVKKQSVKKSDINIDKPFILFISGIDTNGKISKVGRSDVNIVLTINPNTYQVLLTTIPRDYYVQLHGKAGIKDKLTHAGIYGIDMSVNTVEDLLDIDINYYLRVNFDTLVKLVDEIGGITIYSDQNLNFCNIKEGYNNVDGNCALKFARERKSYSSGDRHRGENQEEVIKAIINKVQKSNVLLTKYSAILKNLESNFEINISNVTIKKLIKFQIKKMPKWTVKTYNLNGSDSKNYTYSSANELLYVMEPDMKTVDSAKQIIQDVYDGKTFNQISLIGDDINGDN